MKEPQINPLCHLTTRVQHARVIAQATFAIVAGHCFLSLRDWRVWFGDDPVNVRPVWPVAWINSDDASTLWCVTTVCGLGLSSLLAAGYSKPTLRLLAAVVLFLHFAIEDSRDSIRHGEHGLLWVSMILCCLPRLDESYADRRIGLRFLRIVGSAQFLFLFFYWMAGLAKVVTAVSQATRAEKTLLHPDAGALVIAEWLLRGDASSLLGRWAVEHRYLSWFGLLLGVATELLAVLPGFMKSAQIPIGCMLIAMHGGIGLMMDIWFPENVVLLAVLIIAGPTFSLMPERNSLRQKAAAA